LGQGVADGRSHQRGHARGGDDRGENAGEEAAGEAGLLGEIAAGAGEREAELKLAGEREAEEEDQRGQNGDEAGRLKLEAPAEFAAAGAQDQQRSDDGPETDDDAQRVDKAVGALAALLFAGGVDQGEALEEEDRENARHEVQQQATEKGEADGAKGVEVGTGAGAGKFF
jgi:hypothetical protein